MKVGDLVKLTYDGTITVITRITTTLADDPWYHLLGKETSFRAEKLEVISECR